MLRPKTWVAGLAAAYLAVVAGAQLEIFDAEPAPPNFKPPAVLRHVFTSSMGKLPGLVTVEFVVDTKGAVVNPAVVHSDNPSFERPALEAILNWKFRPATVDGKPVNVRVSKQIEFHVEEGSRMLWAQARAKWWDRPEDQHWKKPPVPVRTVYPVYPFEALLAKKEGSARVRIMIDPHGRAVSSEVLAASAPEFGESLVAAMEAWRFEPARKRDGSAVKTSFTMALKFAPESLSEVPVSSSSLAIIARFVSGEQRVAAPKDLDAPLTPLARWSPAFPSKLVETHRTGEAVIEFFVDELGDVQLPRVISASAPEFGYAAAQAVSTWRFKPPEVAGKRVVVRARLPMTFSVDEKASK